MNRDNQMEKQSMRLAGDVPGAENSIMKKAWSKPELQHLPLSKGTKNNIAITPSDGGFSS